MTKVKIVKNCDTGEYQFGGETDIVIERNIIWDLPDLLVSKIKSKDISNQLYVDKDGNWEFEQINNVFNELQTAGLNIQATTGNKFILLD